MTSRAQTRRVSLGASQWLSLSLTAFSQELSRLFGLAHAPPNDASQSASEAASLTHVDESGRLAMVDVGQKSDTQARHACDTL